MSPARVVAFLLFLVCATRAAADERGRLLLFLVRAELADVVVAEARPSAQRTLLCRSEREIDRGLFVGVSRGGVELTVDGWNLDGEALYAVVALGLEF
jgi:glutathionyl-hydroquinone reductase